MQTKLLKNYLLLLRKQKHDNLVDLAFIFQYNKDHSKRLTFLNKRSLASPKEILGTVRNIKNLSLDKR